MKFPFLMEMRSSRLRRISLPLDAVARGRNDIDKTQMREFGAPHNEKATWFLAGLSLLLKNNKKR